MTTVRLSQRTEFHYEISSSQDKGLTGEREEMREGVDGKLGVQSKAATWMVVERFLVARMIRGL